MENKQDNTKPLPHHANKHDRAKIIINMVLKWQREGATTEEATSKLTPPQFDFMLTYGADNFAKLGLTPLQTQAVNSIVNGVKPLKPLNGKKYPQSKQGVYFALQDFIKSEGATLAEQDKTNFRDMDFTLNDTKYKIVLSVPRT